ncbi:hypothetical protein BSR28_02015 [Boudabousia liubingyangii]|uniref:nucleotide pyrophosphohydrolase n=1 Tax=Boudabousia liubingyangii TaxID=1921764 RepID=UPI00093ABDB1|nr:nucleotide pyrophosphohydrolase [Boudabousia liubingyangii]OKL48492.1 hypothetical protein BSR28_02015 [Boudabousia liubingyangii]
MPEQLGQQPAAQSVNDFAELMRQFCQERDWERFNDPKSLLLALTGELGELAECFQWLPADQAAYLATQEPRAEAIRDEVADVFLYLLQLCNQCGIDLAAATNAKIAKNAAKYPVEAARESAGALAAEHSALAGQDKFAQQGTKLSAPKSSTLE